MADFVHLHLHTLYSLLDGAIRMKDLIKGVQKAGMKSVAVTDHGNMFGTIDFYKKAKEAGIKPILGYEAYIAGPKGMTDRSERVANHLILLAENEEGYKQHPHALEPRVHERHVLPPARGQGPAQAAQQGRVLPSRPVWRAK